MTRTIGIVTFLGQPVPSSEHKNRLHIIKKTKTLSLQLTLSTIETIKEIATTMFTLTRRNLYKH